MTEVGYRLYKILDKYGLYLDEILEMKLPNGQILMYNHYMISKYI